jgi:hypothetical protein
MEELMDNSTRKRRGRGRKIIEGTLVDRMGDTKLIAQKQESGKIVARVMERNKKDRGVDQLSLLGRTSRLDSRISDMRKKSKTCCSNQLVSWKCMYGTVEYAWPWVLSR